MVYGVPYAYDRIRSGQTTGGSIARCTSLLQTLRRQVLGGNPVFILTAGYTKESPTQPSERVPTPICEQMRDYLVHEQGVGPENVVSTPLTWGTYGETLASIEEIKSRGESNHVTVLVCSNPGHLPRVRMCWKFLAPDTWEVVPVPASHSFGSVKERMQETVKFFVYLYRFLAKKW